MHSSTEPVAVSSGAETQLVNTGFWRLVFDAVRGNHYDFTQGDLGRVLLLLAIPMVLEMSMESFFAIVDIKFVAKLGSDAAATVGLTESLMTLI